MNGWRIKSIRHGFAVHDGDGARVSPVFRSADDGVDWYARRLAAHKPRSRACMCCSKAFDSAGIHDRLCPECGRAGGIIGGGGSFAASVPAKRTASR